MNSIRKINRPKLTDVVTERLSAAIRDGELKEGEKLPTERELSEQFGVSRNVVREAVNDLRMRGLITTRQGAGSVVTGDVHKPVRDVIEQLLVGRDGAEGELLELRQTLEVRIASLAAERATQKEIKSMQAILDDFDAAMEDTERCAALDIRFHQALCHATHNQLFSVVIEPLNDLLTRVRTRALSRSGLKVAAASHRAIFAAIEQHNLEQASISMNEHIEITTKAWLDSQTEEDSHD